jgi:hypothetical protein
VADGLHGRFAAAAFLVWGGIRHGSVWLAFNAYRRSDWDRVRALLAATRPYSLGRQDRAYYDWLQGVILARDGRFDAARASLITAAGGPLRTSNARTLVHCHLADVALCVNDRPAAAEHIAQARCLDHRPEVDEMLSALETRLQKLT